MKIDREDVLHDLAPDGRIRAAINFGNPVLAQKDPQTGQAQGVSVDLAHELGRRLGVPVELVTFDAAVKVFEALKTAAWDVAFLAIDPVRAAEISFTPPYVIIEGTYLVREDSPLHSIADFDREGVRIAVGRGAAYDNFLRRSLQARPACQRGHVARCAGTVSRPGTRCRGGSEATARRVCQAARRPARHRGTLYRDRAGYGNTKGARRRVEIPDALYRRDEGLRLRRVGARPQRPTRGGCRATAATPSLTSRDRLC